MLTIEPTNGLCNRMLAIDSAAALAADTDRPLKVIWSVRRNLGCPFHRLFKADGLLFELVEQSKLARSLLNEWRQIRQLTGLAPTVLRRADIDRMIADQIDFASFAEGKNVHIETYRRFYRPFGFGSLFKPVEPLQGHIENITSKFDHCIGVHIRRTDHQTAINQSPTALFIEKMNREIILDSKVTFFVSTDDPQTEHHLRSVFAERIIGYEKRSYDRGRTDAMEDALVDLYCLSRTRRMLGSMGSTFSEVAAELGSIPLELVSTPLGDISKR